MKNLYAATLLLFTALYCSAQQAGNQSHYCYTDEMWGQMVNKDSTLLTARRQMDAAISKLSNAATGHAPVNKNANGPVTDAPSTVIPTVIYIVYDTATVNISMNQIQSQMDQLNRNFAPYGYSFCYAKRNVTDTSWFVPLAGDSAGVFRISSPLSKVGEYGTDAQLKALSSLPSANYLRIFVVHSISPAGILGYTIMPGTNSALDGIVILADVFGSSTICNNCTLQPNYNLGAALTHEAGHFLDLYHTFQGACDSNNSTVSCQIFGDQVCDTPPCDAAYGCPSPTPLSCDGIDTQLIQNYMDYTDDPCKNSFTPGQKSRMDFGTQGYHSVLVSTQNLINTGVNCLQLGNRYADFYCVNFNGCLSRPMFFKSLTSEGFIYTWDFGDGTTATGDSAYHIYSANGEYLVTLTAIDTSKNVSATNTVPVFITDCYFTNCLLNKWDFNYGYLDFSTGTPVATNHPTASAKPVFAEFYNLFYRGDTMGNPLFHIGTRSDNTGLVYSTPLMDTSFNHVDSFSHGSWDGFMLLVPVPGQPDVFCLVQDDTKADTLGGFTDTLVYSIIQAKNGTATVLPGKKSVKVPIPTGNYSPTGYEKIAIPNCDGTSFWIILMGEFSTHIPMLVYELDSGKQLTLHQTFDLPDTNFFYNIVASPNGRMIAMGSANPNLNSWGLSYLNFDKSTGKIANYNVMSTSRPLFSADWSKPRPCFSPNSRFLYYPDVCCASQINNTEYICQSDMYSPNPYGTRKIVYQYPTEGVEFGPALSCRIGPDKKIYIGHTTIPGNSSESYRLSVINYPDTMENGLNLTGYNANGPDIRPDGSPYVGGMNLHGFSWFLDPTDAFNCDWSPGVPGTFSYLPTGCLNYQFYADACWGAQWNFGDPASAAANTSTLEQPTHSFSGPGTYAVKLINNGYTYVDTVRIAEPSVKIASTIINPCPAPYANYSIANVQPYVNYYWTLDHAVPASAQALTNIDVQWSTADSTGTIMVVAVDTVTGCTDTSVLHVNYKARDSVSYNYITASLCPDGSYHFNNKTLTTPGTYTDTVILLGGCRSITQLQLTREVNVGIYASICPGRSYSFNGHTLTIPGTYADTITPAQGCDTIITLYLQPGQAPGVAWPGGNDTFKLQPGSVPLSGGTPAGGAYSGAGVSNNTFHFGQLTAGSYIITYTYMDSNGCSNTASRIFVVWDALNVPDVNIESKIYLYPNPANNTVIAQSELFNAANVQISLYDITGRLIQVPFEKYADKAAFDISSLAGGIYWFRFTVNGAEASKRFVKME